MRTLAALGFIDCDWSTEGNFQYTMTPTGVYCKIILISWLVLALQEPFCLLSMADYQRQHAGRVGLLVIAHRGNWQHQSTPSVRRSGILAEVVESARRSYNIAGSLVSEWSCTRCLSRTPTCNTKVLHANQILNSIQIFQNQF